MKQQYEGDVKMLSAHLDEAAVKSSVRATPSSAADATHTAVATARAPLARTSEQTHDAGATPSSTTAGNSGNSQPGVFFSITGASQHVLIHSRIRHEAPERGRLPPKTTGLRN